MFNGQVKYREWQLIGNGYYTPEDYDIPEAPQAPDVPEEHPEHLSAENLVKVRR